MSQPPQAPAGKRKNSGYLFENDRSNDRQPNFRGKVDVEGKEYWISIWEKPPREGKKNFSVELPPHIGRYWMTMLQFCRVNNEGSVRVEDNDVGIEARFQSTFCILFSCELRSSDAHPLNYALQRDVACASSGPHCWKRNLERSNSTPC